MTLRRRGYLVEAKAIPKIEWPNEYEAAEEGWFQKQYGGYGRLSHKLPVEAWHVDSLSKKVLKVRVLKLRGGGADYYDKYSDYADLEGGKTVSSYYLFPTKGFSKPRPYRVVDQYGEMTRWFGFRRGKKPRVIEVAK